LLYLFSYVVSTLRTDDNVMGKRRTKHYTLSDGQVITCREVADEIGISESAARNRLMKTNNPIQIFAPYDETKREKKAKPKDKVKKILPYEEPLWKLAMKVIGGTK